MKKLSFILLLAFAGCAADSTELPADGTTVPEPELGWPAEGQCRWQSYPNQGCGTKNVEYCTYNGLHCTVIFTCGREYNMGCR